VAVCLTAAACGQHKVLDLLCRRYRFIPLQDDWSSIATFYNAAKTGNVSTVRKLLDDGLHPDTKDIQSRTPLWVAACYGQNAIVELLVQRSDVDVNSLDVASQPPILFPSAAGNEGVVAVLMEAGADPTIADENGETAISIAKKRGHEGVVRILERGGPGRAEGRDVSES